MKGVQKLIIEDGYNWNEAIWIVLVVKPIKYVINIPFKVIKGVRGVCGRKKWHTV